MINVCDIHVMKPLLAEHGFHFSKAKGQNFLTQKWVPESIAQDAGVDETAGVLEIGPGIGPLTQQLCLRAGKVVACELDERLTPIRELTVGDFDTELAEEFWLAFVRNCPASIHIRQMAGKNTHHILEAIFKGMGRTLKMAVAMDEKHLNEIPSTKGTL